MFRQESIRSWTSRSWIRLEETHSAMGQRAYMALTVISILLVGLAVRLSALGWIVAACATAILMWTWWPVLHKTHLFPDGLTPSKAGENLPVPPLSRDDTPTTTWTIPTMPASRFPEPETADENTATLIFPMPVGPQPSLNLVVSGATHPGIKRRRLPNEDTIKIQQGERWLHIGRPQKWGLFVVADGMGGHANGKEASTIAANALVAYIVPRLRGYEWIDASSCTRLLLEGIETANKELLSWNQEHQWDSGTTITAALIVGTTAVIGNVGDSRTYLYRAAEGGLRKITTDHSMVQRLLNAGLITPDEVYTHPKRNQVYRGLGEKPSVEVDIFLEQLQPGDKLLLCSDGLWEMVRDPQIATILATPLHSGEHISDKLIQAALDGGGADNISVIVAAVRDSTHPFEEARTMTLAPAYSA